jgi:hypothetical protein
LLAKTRIRDKYRAEFIGTGFIPGFIPGFTAGFIAGFIPG